MPKRRRQDLVCSKNRLSKLLAFWLSALLGLWGWRIVTAGMLAGAASQVGTEMLDQLPAE